MAVRLNYKERSTAQEVARQLAARLQEWAARFGGPTPQHKQLSMHYVRAFVNHYVDWMLEEAAPTAKLEDTADMAAMDFEIALKKLEAELEKLNERQERSTGKSESDADGGSGEADGTLQGGDQDSG